MADISVTLVLDDSQYTGKLKAAGAAAEDFGAKSKKAAGESGKGFDALGVNVENLKKKFELLQVALLGVGLAEFVRSAMEYADKIEDMAKATGMTIPQILEFQNAVAQAGGSSEGAAKGIQNFYTKIDEARHGSDQAQTAFDRLHISINDLRTLSDQQIFYKTIEELAKLPAGAEQARLSTELLGKTFKGLSVQEVAEKLDQLKGKYDEQGASIQAAAELNKKLEIALTNLKLAALQVFEPIIEALAHFNSTGSAGKIIIEGITVAFGAFAALKVAEMVIGIAEACLLLKEALYGVAAAEAVATGGLSALASLAVKLGVGAIGAAATAYGLDQMADSSKKAAEEQKKLDDARKKAQGEAQDNKVVAAGAKEVAAIQNTTQALKQQIDMMLLKYDKETQLIGQGSIEINRQKLLNQIYDEAANKVAELTRKKTELAAGDQTTGTRAQSGAIDKEIEKINELANLEAAKANKEYEARLVQEEKYRKFLQLEQDDITMRDRLLAITQSSETLGLGNLDKQMKAIDQQATKDAYAKIDAYNKLHEVMMEDGTSYGRLTKEQEQEYITAEKNKQGALKESAKAFYDASRSFSTGWKEAFNAYVDDATNAANQAKNMFDAVVSGMNSAIDTFVTSGKFSFKDMARSIIQDLEKIALKAALANVIKTSGLGSIFAGAFALGGEIPSGQFGLVGEAGPEIVRGPATVTSAKDTASMMGQGAATHNTYNINAIDSKSVAQLFAENRMTLFGTVEQARRELPMRTR